MTYRTNLARMGAMLLSGLLALTPRLAMAQAQSSPAPATTAPAASPAAPQADGMMNQHMMMDNDKMKPGMAMMDCMGKPCGPPQGAAGQMGGMPQPQSMAGPDATAQPAAPAGQAPMKEHM